jgi:hypothetical protein
VFTHQSPPLFLSPGRSGIHAPSFMGRANWVGFETKCSFLLGDATLERLVRKVESFT